MVRELALSFCFVVADLSLTGGSTVFYLGYTIFTSFLFRYAISIVSSKRLWHGSGFDVMLGGVEGTSLSSISYSILLISWYTVVPAELSVIYGSAYLVVLFL